MSETNYPAFSLADVDKVVQCKDLVLVGLHSNEGFCFAGIISFSVFSGRVKIHGFQPQPGVFYDAFSPQWSSCLLIEAAEDADEVEAGKNGPTGSISQDLELLEVAEKLAAKFAVVLILRKMPIDYRNIDAFYIPDTEESQNDCQVETSSVLPGFRIIFGIEYLSSFLDSNIASDFIVSRNLLKSISMIDSLPTLKCPKSWSNSINSIAGTANKHIPKTIVCGAKGVGKSTFCRYLVNSMLSTCKSVAFLDTDLGQSEFTPAGMLSLHVITDPLLGPSHTHMKQAYRSFYFGHSNPKANPMEYINIIKQLLSIYNTKWSLRSDFSMPLVVNTDGWVKSMGHDLLSTVIEESSPDHVVQLLGFTRAKSFSVPMNCSWRVHPIDLWDADPPQPLRSSKEMRRFKLRSYFLAKRKVNLEYNAISRVVMDNSKLDYHIAQVLASEYPYKVPFKSVSIQVTGQTVHPSQILYTLNGSLVGLCVSSQYETYCKNKTYSKSMFPHVLVESALPPCVGLGIIRSVDMKTNSFYIISPVNAKTLRHVNVLVCGNIALNIELICIESALQIPYCVNDIIPSEGSGSGIMKSRNNLKRKKDK